MAGPEPRYILTIRSEPGHGAPPIARLRRLLKVMLRTYGFRCLDVRDFQTNQVENGIGLSWTTEEAPGGLEAS